MTTVSDLSKQYFNLIVIGVDGQWIEKKKADLPRSRMFEYTAPEVEKIFKSDEDPSQIDWEKIKQLPCICTYEGEESTIFYATIQDVSLIDLNIKICLNEPINQPINFSDFYALNKHTMHRFELSRNHWAIKEGDIHTILPSETTETTETTEETKVITSIECFISLLVNGSDKNNKDEEVFYRGHSSNKYQMEPSLFRRSADGSYPYRDIEDLIYRELLSHNYLEFLNDHLTFDKLVRMQHFSLPTRLLDITSNPLIALYFACKNNNNEDGDFISISVPSNSIKYFDSDTVMCIANLTKLNFYEKEKILKIVNGEKPEGYQELKTRFLNYIREDKPYFEDKIKKNDLKKIICVKGKSTNPRISAQSGAFLLFGLETQLYKKNTFSFKITNYTIEANAKKDILKKLDLLNINESTVFPYLENSAKYIADRFKKL